MKKSIAPWVFVGAGLIACSHSPSLPDAPRTPAAIFSSQSLAIQISPDEGRQPTQTDIEPGLVDNQADFQSPFFKQFILQHAPQPLQLTDSISKDYLFPALYGKSVAAIAMFECSYEQAAKLLPNPLPDPRMKPVDMLHGKSLIVITSFRYNEILGMTAYNEVGILIPVVVGPDVPILPIIKNQDYPGLGYVVISMPVTALENQIRGVKIWNLPKVVQEIDHFTDGDDYVTDISDSSGKPYVEMRVPMTGKLEKDMTSRSMILSSIDQKLVEFASTSSGDFVETEFPFVKTRPSSQPPYLKIIGNSSFATTLRNLQIADKPMEIRFGADVSAALDLPGPYSK
jgi:hypothetical protein